MKKILLKQFCNRRKKKEVEKQIKKILNTIQYKLILETKNN